MSPLRPLIRPLIRPILRPLTGGALGTSRADTPSPGYVFARQPNGTIIRQPDGKPVQIPIV